MNLSQLAVFTCMAVIALAHAGCADHKHKNTLTVENNSPSSVFVAYTGPDNGNFSVASGESGSADHLDDGVYSIRIDSSAAVGSPDTIEIIIELRKEQLATLVVKSNGTIFWR